MPTLTISIPDGMKPRLSKHGNTFNVSRVCQDALDRELRVRELLDGENQMTMVEKMKVQSETKREEVRQQGRESGIEWAQEHADFDSLQLFKDYYDNDPERDVNQRDVEDVIESGQSADVYEKRKDKMFFNDWFEGYIEGAVEAFNEVLPKIESD